MSVRLDEPAEAYGRVVQKILLPEVAHALELDAPDHEADDRERPTLELRGRAERDGRLRAFAYERLEITESSLIDIEQRAAVRTRDALRAVGRAKLKRAAAVRAVELSRRDLLRLALALRSGACESEFVERDFATDEDERRLFSVVERAEGPVVAR